MFRLVRMPVRRVFASHLTAKSFHSNIQDQRLSQISEPANPDLLVPFLRQEIQSQKREIEQLNKMLGQYEQEKLIETARKDRADKFGSILLFCASLSLLYAFVIPARRPD